MIKYNINENFFKTWTVEMAYVLGFWYADGNLSRQNKISFASKDYEILDKIRSVMSSNHLIYKVKRDNCYILTIARKKICDDIRHLGGVCRKSLIATFPKIPNKYKIHFIRGYFDGDGSIYLSNTDYPTICFTGCNKFLNGIINYFKDITYSLTKKSNSPVYDLRYRGVVAQYIIRQIYNKCGWLYLKRKYSLSNKGLLWCGEIKRKWTDSDISSLLYLKSIEIPGNDIADLLNRTYGSVSTRLYRL